jgi:AcrR family transcriptional regulator
MRAALSRKNPSREQILETASRLFYRDGIRAVGVDTIIAESGVAKMTLYRHFVSKDDLVVAYLERTHAKFREWMESRIATHAGHPRRALEAIFEGVAELTSSPTCLGCAFLGTAAEFPDLKHPGHRKAMEHKRDVLARLAELAGAAGLRDRAELAEELLLLMDGAWGAVRMFGARSHASRVAAAARALIAAHAAPRPR